MKISNFNYNNPKNYQSHNNKQKLHFDGLKAMIFDMDGTMVYSLEYHFKAWLELCLQYKPQNIDLKNEKGLCQENLKKVIESYKGGTSEEFIRQLYGDIPENLVKHLVQKRNELFCQYLDEINEVEGLSEFLNETKEIKKAIATSSSADVVAKILNKFEIKQYFNAIVDPSIIKKGKPEPDTFLKAAEKLEISPNECLAFEDSIGGITSAQKADMEVIGIASSLSTEDLQRLKVKMAIKNYSEINIADLKKMFD